MVQYARFSRILEMYYCVFSFQVLLLSGGKMRAMAIFGAASNEKELQAFRDEQRISWHSDLTAAEAVLIFGGDGTVHRYLSQLVNLQLPCWWCREGAEMTLRGH
jgi:hypothetical protein